VSANHPDHRKDSYSNAGHVNSDREDRGGGENRGKARPSLNVTLLITLRNGLFHYQHHDADQHQDQGKTEAKGDQQKKAEAGTPDRNTAQQQNQRGGTRNQAPADAQRDQAAHGHIPFWNVTVRVAIVGMGVAIVGMGVAIVGMGMWGVLVVLMRMGMVVVPMGLIVLMVMMIVRVQVTCFFRQKLLRPPVK
jgi:hypothetical protein